MYMEWVTRCAAEQPDQPSTAAATHEMHGININTSATVQNTHPPSKGGITAQQLHLG
jgi:hypothetical protein